MKQQKTWTFSGLLDGWKILQLERKGHTAEQAKQRLKRKYGRRLTNIKLESTRG